MTQFFGLVSLNAANFDSGDANSGDVLTANGFGGATFAAPTGGGGFAYDGATFTPDTYYELAQSRIIAIDLTANGASVAPGWYSVEIACVWIASGNHYEAFTGLEVWGDIGLRFIEREKSGMVLSYFYHKVADEEVSLGINVINQDAADHDALVLVYLPDGSVVASDAIAIPGAGS